jgi:hypothetical protein
MDKGRKADIDMLKTEYGRADPKKKKEIKESVDFIRKEQSDGYKRSGRESLIREMRKGNAGNVRDISEGIMKKKNEIGRTSFSFDVSDERWREIFGK